MNVLTGEITEVTTEQTISLVKVLAGGQLFYSIVIDTPITSPWLKTGGQVRLLFKETEVMVALPPITPANPTTAPSSPLPSTPANPPTSTSPITSTTQNSSPILPISVRNQLPCLISSITSGAILCELTLTLSLNPSIQIKAIITREACISLHLKENLPVIALIKTNEVSLAHD